MEAIGLACFWLLIWLGFKMQRGDWYDIDIFFDDVIGYICPVACNG